MYSIEGYFSFSVNFLTLQQPSYQIFSPTNINEDSKYTNNKVDWTDGAISTCLI